MNQTTEAYKMLLELINKKASSARITESELEKYFQPEGIVFGQNYLQRLASSLQNSGMMHNSIRFNESEERYDHIKQVLCDFDAQKVLRKYSTWKALYNALTHNGEWDKGKQKEEDDIKTNWGKYAKGLYAGVDFLENKKGNQKIAALCQEPADEAELDKKIKELKHIERSIHGLGFALTCDWLKECGCTWLAKPDIHIRKVCAALAAIENEEKMTDVDVIKFVFHFAKELRQAYPDVTGYKLDKIIWLICTGNFYLQKDKIGRDTILAKVKSGFL